MRWVWLQFSPYAGSVLTLARPFVDIGKIFGDLASGLAVRVGFFRRIRV